MADPLAKQWEKGGRNDGGAGSAARGVKTLLSRDGEKLDLVSALGGGVAGILGCLAFTGVGTASAATSMAGVSGILLSLEALGGKSGWLRTLAQSLTAQKQNGARLEQTGKLQSLLTGLTGGFALSTVVTSLLPLLQGGAK